MKVIIILAVLASSNLFANDRSDLFIKCYEPAQQNGRLKLAFKFEKNRENPERSPNLVYPVSGETISEQVQYEDGYFYQCIQADDVINEEVNIRFCRGEGSRRNGLFPVEVTYIVPEGEEDIESETVYCEQSFSQWVFGIPK